MGQQANRNFFVLALLLIAVGVSALFLPVKDWAVASQSWLQTLGWIGPLVFVIAYVLATIFLIPGSALTLVAGAVFGLWIGSITVITGANLGALCAFLLSKTTWHQKAQTWAEGYPKFAALDRAISNNGFRMVLLTRLSPVFPFTLLNYFLGLTSVTTGAYVFGNLIGMLPATFLYVYLGSLAGETLSGAVTNKVRTAQLILKIAGLVATLAVVIYVTRVAKKAIEAEERAQTNTQNIPSS